MLHIVIVHNTSGTEHSAVTMCIQHYVPSAVLKSSVANEMKFVLPTSNRTNFYDLFRTLEERREELQIASFGVSDPTLEEVNYYLSRVMRKPAFHIGENKGTFDFAT